MLHWVVVCAVLLPNGVIALVLLAVLVDQLILVYVFLLVHEFLIHGTLSRTFILLCKEAMI